MYCQLAGSVLECSGVIWRFGELVIFLLFGHLRCPEVILFEKARHASHALNLLQTAPRIMPRPRFSTIFVPSIVWEACCKYVENTLKLNYKKSTSEGHENVLFLSHFCQKVEKSTFMFWCGNRSSGSYFIWSYRFWVPPERDLSVRNHHSGSISRPGWVLREKSGKKIQVASSAS